jgi:hypothetical protein
MLREFSELEEGVAAFFLRDMQGAPPVRLGNGIAQQLSSGRQVGARDPRETRS